MSIQLSWPANTSRDKAGTGGTHRVEKKKLHIVWSIFGGTILNQVMRAPAGCEWQYIVQDRHGGLLKCLWCVYMPSSGYNNNNNEHISRALFHVKHAHTAMADSQRPQKKKKTDQKSTVSQNNVHTTAPKWRRRHYMDQRNKSKTLKSKNPRKKQKKTSEFTQAAQRVGVTSKMFVSNLFALAYH